MTSIRANITRYPVLSYYALVFAISVGGMLLVVGGPGGLPGTGEQVGTLFPIVFLALYVGPVVSSLLMTGLVSGREGYRDLFSRLLRWRVGLQWYAVAILTIPLLMTAVYLPLSRVSSEFLPVIIAPGGGSAPLLSGLGIAAGDNGTLLLVGLVAGLAFGFLEELSWTGFAIPWVKQRHGVLATGLIVGALWAAWHTPITFWSTGDPSGAFSPALFLPPFVFYIADLTAYRVLMVWVYERTESLLVATLMHASLIFSSIVVLAPVATGMPLVAYWLVLAVALWAVVAVVNRSRGRQPSRQSLKRQAA